MTMIINSTAVKLTNVLMRYRINRD